MAPDDGWAAGLVGFPSLLGSVSPLRYRFWFFQRVPPTRRARRPVRLRRRFARVVHPLLRLHPPIVPQAWPPTGTTASIGGQPVAGSPTGGKGARGMAEQRQRVRVRRASAISPTAQDQDNGGRRNDRPQPPCQSRHTDILPL